MSNLHRKLAPIDSPHETWVGHGPDAGWTWRVLRKYSPATDHKRPFNRWLCHVTQPGNPGGDVGDCYVRDVQANATLSHFQA